MHEVSIAEEIKNVVIKKLNENNGKKVKKIKLLIGEMTTIVPEALQFALTIVSENTPMEDCKVKIKVLKTKARCNLCYKEFFIRDNNFLCSKCKTHEIEIIQGREMIIQSVEMER
ncbi:MAG: hydrogenase maturation nickel metallochaperone HypA [Candidatus Goldbacteria bacterium]|nr:hydrogenase maturation nickel metallochaperone HypA [Candidatus Goldiibacteriota bacterium]